MLQKFKNQQSESDSDCFFVQKWGRIRMQIATPNKNIIKLIMTTYVHIPLVIKA